MNSIKSQLAVAGTSTRPVTIVTGENCSLLTGREQRAEDALSDAVKAPSSRSVLILLIFFSKICIPHFNTLFCITIVSVESISLDSGDDNV